jgi:hypothetical protein
MLGQIKCNILKGRRIGENPDALASMLGKQVDQWPAGTCIMHALVGS